MFVGSVFSPHYARARRQRTPAPAARHLAVNLALYGDQAAWLMHEDRRAPAPAAAAFRLAGNRATQRGGEVHLSFADRTCPWRRPLVGHVRLSPAGPPTAGPRPLHPRRPHWWWPVAPAARVEVSFDRPRLAWRGRAYADVNWGHEPLAAAFRRWLWQRLWHPEGTLVSFAGTLDDGHPFRADELWRPGAATPQAAPAAPLCALPQSGWGIARQAVGRPLAHRSLEDTPFYSRSALAVDWLGARMEGMHEALDLERFDRRWVQFLLPFRGRLSS